MDWMIIISSLLSFVGGGTIVGAIRLYIERQDQKMLDDSCRAFLRLESWNTNNLYDLSTLFIENSGKSIAYDVQIFLDDKYLQTWAYLDTKDEIKKLDTQTMTSYPIIFKTNSNICWIGIHHKIVAKYKSGKTKYTQIVYEGEPRRSLI